MQVYNLLWKTVVKKKIKSINKTDQALEPNTNLQEIQGPKAYIKKHHEGIIKIQTIKIYLFLKQMYYKE